MLMDTQTPSGRVPVAAYICTVEDDTAGMIADYVGQYAQAREWAMVEVVRDTDRRTLLSDRPGWQHLLTLLSSGQTRGLVTYSRAMVAPDAAAYERLVVLLVELGAFLACARQSTPQSLPRRTPGDAYRRYQLAEAASGWSTVTPA